MTTSAKIIDVSSYQHAGGSAINWDLVLRSGVRGVMRKATQGTSYVDPGFMDDVAQAHKAGLAVGCYHFATPTADSAEDEALWFINNTGGLSLELGWSLDWESWGAMTIDERVSWVAAFWKASGIAPLNASVYTYQSEWINLQGSLPPIRYWAIDPGGFNVQGAWMIQTGEADVPGVDGLCDIDTLVNARSINLPPVSGGSPTTESDDDMLLVRCSDPPTGEVEWHLLSGGLRVPVATPDDLRALNTCPAIAQLKASELSWATLSGFPAIDKPAPASEPESDDDQLSDDDPLGLATA